MTVFFVSPYIYRVDFHETDYCLISGRIKLEPRSNQQA